MTIEKEWKKWLSFFILCEPKNTYVTEGENRRYEIER
jgi:hypothetical protein